MTIEEMIQKSVEKMNQPPSKYLPYELIISSIQCKAETYKDLKDGDIPELKKYLLMIIFQRFKP